MHLSLVFSDVLLKDCALSKQGHGQLTWKQALLSHKVRDHHGLLHKQQYIKVMEREEKNPNGN